MENLAYMKAHPFDKYYSMVALPIIITNREIGMIYANKEAEALFDLKEQAFKETSIFNYVDEIDHEFAIRQFDNLNELKKQTVEFEVRCTKECVNWLQIKANAFTYEENEFILLSIQNITKQKQTQSLLEMKKHVLERITKGDSLSAVLNELSLRIEKQFNRNVHCTILTLDKETETIDDAIGPNIPNEFHELVCGEKIGPCAGSCGTAMYRSETVIVSNMAESPLWEKYRELPLSYGLKACWSTPIFIKGKVVGAFAIYHFENVEPNDYELQIIEACAHLAGLTIERKQKEQTLIAKSELKYQMIAEHTSDAICVIDCEGNVQYSSPSQETIKGYPPEEYENVNVFNFIHPADVSDVKEAFLKMVEKKTGGELNFRYLHKEGHYIYLQTRGKPVLSPDEEVESFVFISQDVTAQKLAEQRLAISEQRYKSLFEHHPEAIVSMDLEGKLTHFNSAFAHALKYSLKEYNTSYQKFMAPEHLDITNYHFNQAKKGIPQHYESSVIDKDGKHLYFNVTNVPIIVEDQIVGVYGIGQDITERKQTAEELRKVKEYLESIFHNSADAISVFGFDKIVTEVNPSFETLYGWTKEEVIGRTIPPLIPDSYRKEIDEVIEVVKSGQKVMGHESLRRRKDGTLIHVSSTFSPITNGKGEMTAVSVISRDITEKKKTEALLKKADKLSALGQLSAAVAHEIRNPLTSIRGFTQLLEDKIEKEYFTIMLSEFDRIEEIISEFLTLAKPEAAQYSEQSIVTIIEKTLSIIGSQASFHNITIQKDFAENLVNVTCNENKMKQVFLNLFKNSIEAMPSGGTLSIEVKKHKGKILTKIIDTGCGIPEERIARLGEPFYSSKEKGTGLGLMMSLKIIQEHQGEILFYSKEGNGTVVEVFMPMSEQKKLSSSSV